MLRLNQLSKLDAALAYADLAWSVFPVRGHIRGGVPLDNTGGPEGLGSTDPGQVRRWFEEANPYTNVAIKTGGLSGLVVISVSGDKGRDSLKALESKYGPLPETLTARYPGGLDLYFRSDKAQQIHTYPDSLGPGLHVYGGCLGVIAPPTAGRKWLNDLEPAVAPPWLVRLMLKPRRWDIERRAERFADRFASNWAGRGRAA